MKVFFYTLGCRVNQYETDAMRQMFSEHGWEITDDPRNADVCVVNTCTVTGEADRKSRQQLRRMARLKPDAVICAVGCGARMNKGLIDADVVCGTRDKHLLLSRIEGFIASGKEHAHKGVYDASSEEKGFAEFGTVLSPEGTRAYIKVEDGCDNFCSYCIIPFARGRVVSRLEENVLSEVEELSRRGISEVCITGIHLCSYGKDRGEDIMSLYSLIHKICLIDGIERVSLGSLEPKSMTDGFIEALRTEQKLMPHFHLSLQSGSDEVLKRMRRTYDTKTYLGRVRKLRESFPSMSLTTDIICGFPGETDDEFSETKDFVYEAGINKIHVFPYSIREGTRAASMEQVPGNISSARVKELIGISDELEAKFASSFIGENVEVMVEKTEEIDGVNFLCGYTKEYVYSKIRTGDPAADRTGHLVNAIATGVSECVLLADILS